MKPHAKTALSLALAIVGGIAAGMRCDASVKVESSSHFNPRPAAYTVKHIQKDPFIPCWTFLRRVEALQLLNPIAADRRITCRLASASLRAGRGKA